MSAQATQHSDKETRFGFGENWSEYSKLISDEHIKKAEEGLLRLLSPEQIKGKDIIDIGCGSGLHALAALRLGAKSVTGIDIDTNSVQTTQNLLKAHAPHDQYTIFHHDILAENTAQNPALNKKYDVVYSWGVLHHTGSMMRAIDNAAHFVKDDGLYVIALYKKTSCCKMWAGIKYLYNKIPYFLQTILVYLYSTAFSLALLLNGKNPVTYIKNYKQDRGMNFIIDVRDWMGGYPYESITPEAITTYMAQKGFEKTKELNTETTIGLFGTGCAEFVFRKSLTS